MASAKAKIRHVFGDTFSCRAAPPDILVKLSGDKAFTSRLSTSLKYEIPSSYRENVQNNLIHF